MVVITGSSALDRLSRNISAGRVDTTYCGFLAVAAVLAVLCGVSGPAAAQPTRDPFVRSMRTLARFPSALRMARLVTSEDGTRQAYVERTGDQTCRVVENGTAQAVYQQCGLRLFTFSSGAGRLFYDAVDAENRPWLVVDGVPVAIADVRDDRVAWSRRGGRRWAATGRSPRDDGNGRPAVVVAVDGKVLGPWLDASRPAVSDDDAQVAVVVQPPDGGLRLMANGAEARRYPSGVTACGMPAAPGSELGRYVQLRYLNDGRLIQVAPGGDGWAVYRDGVRLASYGATVPAAAAANESHAPAPECQPRAALLVGSVNVAEQTPVAVWWERVAGDPDGPDPRWQVSRDGTPASAVRCRWPAPAGDDIAVTADGRHVGFTCAAAGSGPSAEVYAVLDDRRFGPYRQVWGAAVSPDGDHLVYAAAGGGGAAPWRVYRDGVPLSRSYWSIWPPRFSPDGRFAAWEALIDREGRGVAGIDGRALALFNGVLSGPLFPAADRAAWILLRARRVVRLEVELR